MMISPTPSALRLIAVPGVHRPVSDTWMLAEAMLDEGVSGKRVVDLCTGSGTLAIAAQEAGAGEVVAVDISRRAHAATLINARLNRARVEVRRGDLIAALGEDHFDIIVANPPYVPAASTDLPRHRSMTPLDGGRDGRLILDRICSQAARHLNPGGTVLLVHSSVCDTERTCDLLEMGGLEVDVVRRRRGALGPLLRARAETMREPGLFDARDEERLVVVRGRR